MSKLANYFFSAGSRRMGCDQMKLLKPNSDHNTRMAGNHSMWQLRDDRALTHSHSTGGDHLSKIGCEAVLLEGVRDGHCTGLPDGFNLADYIPSYNVTKCFMPHQALAHMFVHLNKRSPESAWRDFADISEFISRFPHRFLMPDGCSTIPLLFLTRDNAHGVGSLSTRFGMVMLARLHGFYYVNLDSEEAGQSRRLAHEGVNGAAIRHLTGLPFDLPINVPDQADEASTIWAEDLLQKEVVEKFPATYKTGDAEDGIVSADLPRSTKLASGFEWPTGRQGEAFLAAAKKGSVAMEAFLESGSLPELEGFEYPGAAVTSHKSQVTSHKLQVTSYRSIEL